MFSMRRNHFGAHLRRDREMLADQLAQFINLLQGIVQTGEHGWHVQQPLIIRKKRRAHEDAARCGFNSKDATTVYFLVRSSRGVSFSLRRMACWLGVGLRSNLIFVAHNLSLNPLIVRFVLTDDLTPDFRGDV